MPFKSRAQQRWMFAAESRGELPKGTALEWAHATQKLPGGFKKLPEHVKKKRPRPQKMKHQKAAEESVKNPHLSGFESLLPALALGAGGALYGAAKAPGGSHLRGALIGGLGGAGAGAGFTAGHHLMNSKYAEPMASTGMGAAAMLGGAAAGGHLGLNAGRSLAHALHMGDDNDKVDNDLQEIDIMSDKSRVLPEYFRDYVHHKKAEESIDSLFKEAGYLQQGGRPKYKTTQPSRTTVSKGKSTIQHGSVKGQKTAAAEGFEPTVTGSEAIRQKVAEASVAAMFKAAGGLLYRNMEEPSQLTLMDSDTGEEALVPAMRTQEPRLLTSLFTGPGKDYESAAMAAVRAHQAKNPGGPPPTLQQIADIMGPDLRNKYPDRYHDPEKPLPDQTTMADYVVPGLGLVGGVLAARLLVKSLAHAARSTPAKPDSGMPNLPKPKHSPSLPELPSPSPHRAPIAAAPPVELPKTAGEQSSKGKSTIQHGSVKGQKTAKVQDDAADLARAVAAAAPQSDDLKTLMVPAALAGLAGAGTAMIPPAAALGGAVYGGLTAPHGRRLHGAHAAAHQAGGTAAGVGLGGFGGALLGASVAPEEYRGTAALAGLLAGGALGGLGANYYTREAYPGPRQLGLGDREGYDKMAAWSNLAKMASCGQLDGCVKRAWEPVSALNPENSAEAPVSALSPENVADEPVSALAPANVPPAAPAASAAPPAPQPSWLGQHGLATGAGAAAGLGAAHLFNQMGSPDELDEEGQPRRSSLGMIPSALAAGVGGLGGAYLSGGLPGLSGLPNLSYDPKTAAWRALAKRAADTGLAALAAPASPAAGPGVKPVPALVGTPKPSPIVPGAVKQELTGAELRARQNPIKPVNPGEYSNATYWSHGMNGLHPMTAGSGVAQPSFTGPVTDALKGGMSEERMLQRFREWNARQNQPTSVPQPVPDALNGRYTPPAPGTTKPDDPFLLRMEQQLREWDEQDQSGNPGLPNVPHPPGHGFFGAVDNIVGAGGLQNAAAQAGVEAGSRLPTVARDTAWPVSSALSRPGPEAMRAYRQSMIDMMTPGTSTLGGAAGQALGSAVGSAAAPAPGSASLAQPGSGLPNVPHPAP